MSKRTSTKISLRTFNCDYLFCLTYKTMKTTMKEERKKNKIIVFNSKKEFGRGHSFIRSAKKSKIWNAIPIHVLGERLDGSII